MWLSQQKSFIICDDGSAFASGCFWARGHFSNRALKKESVVLPSQVLQESTEDFLNNTTEKPCGPLLLDLLVVVFGRIRKLHGLWPSPMDATKLPFLGRRSTCARFRLLTNRWKPNLNPLPTMRTYELLLCPTASTRKPTSKCCSLSKSHDDSRMLAVPLH